MTDPPRHCPATVRDNGRTRQCHRPPDQPWHHAGTTWWLTDWPGGMHQDPNHEPDCQPDPGPIGDFDCCHDSTAAAQLARHGQPADPPGQADDHPDQTQNPSDPATPAPAQQTERE